MPLTFKEVAEILKLIDASDCEEVVLELEGTRLVVRRGGAAGPGLAEAAGTTRQKQQADAPAPALGAARPPSPQPKSAAPAEPGAVEVRSPMVGTFYRRPSPDEPEFVEEGSRVKAGDPLCLIEVMKLFTTIESPIDGIVVSIALSDASYVEFNQLLFQIRPS